MFRGVIDFNVTISEKMTHGCKLECSGLYDQLRFMLQPRGKVQLVLK